MLVDILSQCSIFITPQRLAESIDRMDRAYGRRYNRLLSSATHGASEKAGTR
jgi:hypothetical protein